MSASVAPGPEAFLNRELSWLAFNERVLEEGLDPTTPLLERLKFLGIVSSNLDEFFMIRVAGLERQVAAGRDDPAPPDDARPSEVLAEIAKKTSGMLERQYRAFHKEILPALRAQGIRILSPERLTPSQRATASLRFRTEVFPVLTPLAVDPGRPFPLIVGGGLFWAFRLGEKGKRGAKHLSLLQVPPVLPRLVPLPAPKNQVHLLLLEDLIALNLGRIYPHYRVHERLLLRVTRDADLDLQEEEADDLLVEIEQELRERRRGAGVRIEIEKRTGTGGRATLLPDLLEALGLEARALYLLPGPLSLHEIAPLVPGPETLREAPPPPRVPLAEEADPFAAIARKDVLLHHPYDSFGSVVDFIRRAAADPGVLAIKMTLYRVGKDAPVLEALVAAAEAGKQVTVLLELRARFDEARNIEWARRLERAGAHVVYGLVGLKTHAKLLLVVRREKGGIRRYVHLGTGNYNTVTARVYTDLGLLTAREEIASDVTTLFNALSGFARPDAWEVLAVAPMTLRKRVIELIDREAARSSVAEPGRILAKLNSLTDRETILALYRAAARGVKIDLVVRGICCLRPGVPGLSETIRVRSIVDRYLEHSRAMYFANGGRPEVYISSADWMPRNFDGRVEAMCPVLDRDVMEELKRILETFFADNVKARLLLPDGRYRRAPKIGAKVRAQEALHTTAAPAAREKAWVPIEAPHAAPPAPAAGPAAAPK